MFVMSLSILAILNLQRLVQELAKFEIDTHNIVVNQVLYPEASVGSSAGHKECGKCLARRRMQAKYLEQIQSLYDDFHVVHMPLLDEEVRGNAAIEVSGSAAVDRGMIRSRGTELTPS
jgi:arsenite-transporting ATPase